MKCRNCNVEINSLTDNCPLCDKYLPRDDAERYASYPNINVIALRGGRLWIKLGLFGLIIVTMTVFFVNMLTPHKFIWSIIPGTAIWMLWLSIAVPFIKRKITPRMIVIDNVMISIFLIIIDVTFKQDAWAMSYVVPFVLSGSALIVTIIVLCLKMTWKEFYYYQLAIAIICFIPLIARCYFNFIIWPSIVSAIYGAITIIGMLIFGDKKLKFEAKKRLHF